ncbi:MAG: methyltransferase domain-containing protein, partial [Patescibacteria group bacterium]
MFLWQDLTIKSKFNGEIKLKKFFGRYSVWVGGYEQSGPLVEKLWHKALKEVLLRNVLILGLGCGSILKPLLKKYPHSQITGVEIDPVMIALGKKYFNLDKIANLKIIIADATKTKLKDDFDLIIYDLYSGGELPKIIKFPFTSGQIILNYLRFGKSNEEKQRFQKKLENVFRIDNQLEAEYNTLFFLSPLR